ncbi:MAG: hypothetical protein WAK18_18610 [Nocardioidaceae bacterium]
MADVPKGDREAAGAPSDPDSATTVTPVPPPSDAAPATTDPPKAETTTDLPRTVGATPVDEPGSRPRPVDPSLSRHEQNAVAARPSRLATGGKKVKAGADLVRSRLASLVWLVAVLAAIVLSVGALLIALKANQDNTLVSWVLDVASRIDGPFWRIFEFYQDKKGPGQGPHDAVKEHLVNWGLAAVAYLIAGRILDRVIRP